MGATILAIDALQIRCLWSHKSQLLTRASEAIAATLATDALPICRGWVTNIHLYAVTAAVATAITTSVTKIVFSADCHSSSPFFVVGGCCQVIQVIACSAKLVTRSTARDTGPGPWCEADF